jgi:hypothetical protein
MNIDTLVAFVALLALLGICIWTRRYGDRGLFPGRLHVALGVSVVMIAATLFVIYRETRAPSELTQYIAAYPNLAHSVFIPDVEDNSTTKMWMFVSPDHPTEVFAFYRDERNRPGWAIRPGTGENGSMTLEKRDVRLIITAATIDNETNIVYQLQHR